MTRSLSAAGCVLAAPRVTLRACVCVSALSGKCVPGGCACGCRRLGAITYTPGVQACSSWRALEPARAASPLRGSLGWSQFPWTCSYTWRAYQRLPPQLHGAALQQQQQQPSAHAGCKVDWSRCGACVTCLDRAAVMGLQLPAPGDTPSGQRPRKLHVSHAAPCCKRCAWRACPRCSSIHAPCCCCSWCGE